MSEIEKTEDVVEETVVTETPETDADIIEKSLIDVDVDDAEDSDDKEEPKEAAEEGDSVELKMPEGLGIDDEVLDHGLFNKLLPNFQKAGIKQDDLNEIVKTYADHVEEAAKAHGDKLIERYKEIKNEWKSETQKTLGNEIKQNLMYVGNALKQFGSPKLVELFNETGVGDHIEVVKAFAKIGKHFTEDSMVDGKSATEGKAEDILYPSMK